MAKYHINPETGNAGECSAKKDNCPFGADSEHYTTPEAAREAYEKTQEGKAANVKAAKRPAPLSASDFGFGNIERTDFTGPIAAQFLESSGVLSTIERVDSITPEESEKIVQRRADGSAYFSSQNLLRGHKTFSRSERVMTRIAASLLGEDASINLAYDLGALDQTNRYLFLQAIAAASEMKIARVPF